MADAPTGVPADVPIPIPPGDVVPGGVVLQKSAAGGEISGKVQLLRDATVNIHAVSSAHGDNFEANVTLRVNGATRDFVEFKHTPTPGGPITWSGTVETAMNFNAGADYDIQVHQWNHNAEAVNASLIITVVMN
jgi:hypothetical protein